MVFIACSTCFGQYYAHHQELESIIQMVAACGIWCFGFQDVGMVWSWRLCVQFPGNKICNKYHLLHLVGILFPHNDDDARSKSLQIFHNVWRSTFDNIPPPPPQPPLSDTKFVHPKGCSYIQITIQLYIKAFWKIQTKWKNCNFQTYKHKKNLPHRV